MKSEYCTQCGHKNIYSLKAPKFCSNCGEPLSSDTLPRLSAGNKIKNVKLLDDETNMDYVPNIKTLDFEVEHDHGSYFKFESLVGGKQVSQSIERRDLNDKKPPKNG